MAPNPNGQADSPPDPAVNQAADGASERLRAALGSNGEDQGQEQPPAAAPGGDGVSRPDPTTPTTIAIPVGDGVTQEVPVDQLQTLLRNQRELEQAQATADQILTRAVGAKNLAERIEALPADQREAVLRVIADPSSLGQAPPQPQPQGDILDDLLGEPQGTPAQAPQAGNQDPSVQSLTQQVQTLAQAVAGLIGTQNQGALEQSVDQVMGSFDVFKEPTPDKPNPLYSKEGKAFSRSAIMRHLAANPQQDLRALVAEYATGVHRIDRGGAGAGPSPTPADPRGLLGGQTLNPPEQPISGDDFMRGGVARTLRDRLKL